MSNETDDKDELKDDLEQTSTNTTKTETKKKSGKKGNLFIAIAAILLIVAGIGIFSYPIIMKTISSYKQEKMQEEIKSVILDNMKQAQEEAAREATDQSHAASNPDEVTDTATPTPTPQALEDVELVEDDEVTDTEDAADVKDRLMGQELLGLIEIDSMDLFYAVIEGTNKDNLSAGIGHMTGTAAIGEVGNCALAGHRGGTYGKYFRHIDELSIDDEIKLTDIAGTEYIYIVYDMFIVEPEEMWVIDPVDEVSRTLTLITCENNGTQRLIVRAKIQE